MRQREIWLIPASVYDCDYDIISALLHCLHQYVTVHIKINNTSQKNVEIQKTLESKVNKYGKCKRLGKDTL